MSLTILIITYLIGIPIVTLSLMDYVTVKELICSFIAALFWPILLPVNFIRKLIRR